MHEVIGKTGKVKREQLFPRYHQLDVVRKLLADAQEKSVGRRILAQHSAGSGKSNSIAWLAHQLVRLANDTDPVFDSVIVVTDRRILDQQIRDTIKQFAQVGATVGHAERSGDPNRLHDLKAALDDCQIYQPSQIDQFVEFYLAGAGRDRLDPVLDACVASYKENLDEDGQADFKGKAKTFIRTYAFISSILPFTNAAWEKLSIFLNFLVLKLPAPRDEDLSKGILDAIDMDIRRDTVDIGQRPERQDKICPGWIEIR